MTSYINERVESTAAGYEHIQSPLLLSLRLKIFYSTQLMTPNITLEKRH